MTYTEESIIKINQNENRRFQLQQMFSEIPQYNVIAHEIIGRKIRTKDNHWLIDFASCNYLGLDLDNEMQNGVDRQIHKWGVHPSWCRLVASPQLYQEAEEKLANLIGTETTLILPTVTLISIGVIPALIGKQGVLFLDKSGHETMYEAAKIARDNGATLVSFKQDDFTTLESLLIKHKDNPRKVILVDGVYSMSGDFADLPNLTHLARKYGALLYIDDAHGFGVVGENPTPSMPLGYKGNGIVKHFGLDYENIIYVGGCSKAYSSLAAFVGCSKKMKQFLQAFATPYDLSGPCPTASLTTLLNGLEINEKHGDHYRKILWNWTDSLISQLRNMGLKLYNQTGFPIVYVPIGDNKLLIDTANLLYKEGILVTVSPYPMVPRGQEGHRITLTAANTAEEVELLVNAFKHVQECLMNNDTFTMAKAS